jgi:hypothetical protein
VLRRFYLILASFLLIASQISAQAQPAVAQAHEWHYAWLNDKGGARSLHLTISAENVEKGFLGSRDLLDSKALGHQILDEAKGYALGLSDSLVRVSLIGDSLSNYEIKVARISGRSADAHDRMQLMKSFIQEKVRSINQTSYYRYDETIGGLAIDYNAILRDYESLIVEVLVAMSEQLQITDADDLRLALLDMLQSLPYTDLDNDDYPLLNPVRMLVEQRGDCESKQVFMVGALKILYPDDTIYLVLLPKQEHIVLMQRDSTGKALYMDATGPVRRKPGLSLPSISLNEGILYEVSF